MRSPSLTWRVFQRYSSCPLSQLFDLGGRLLPDIGEKICIKGRIRSAGKLEIQPNADAQFIARIKQFVVLIVSTTPKAQRVHVYRRRVGHVKLQCFLVQPRWKSVRRNPIRAFGEERHAVHDELHRRSILVCCRASIVRRPIRFCLVSRTFPSASSNSISTL